MNIPNILKYLYPDSAQEVDGGRSECRRGGFSLESFHSGAEWFGMNL